MLYEHANKEKLYLDQRIRQLQDKIAELPEGTLCCARNGTRYKWYESIHGQKKYLSKKQFLLAKQLAEKKYLSVELEAMQQEQKAVDAYLAKSLYPDYSRKQSQLIGNPEFQRLLGAAFFPQQEQAGRWMTEAYQTNPKMQDQLIHKTYAGIGVRSKSEALIANALFANKIPFRYENYIKIQNVELYPDFTICHPVTGNIYYWEHFGMMDDEAYARKTASKITLYQSGGITPTVQLIMTFETKKNPLDFEYVETLIRHYFL